MIFKADSACKPLPTLSFLQTGKDTFLGHGTILNVYVTPFYGCKREKFYFCSDNTTHVKFDFDTT